MKKKIKIVLFVLIILGILILNITYKNKNEVTITKQRNQNNLAIMIKNESGDYVSSDSIPKGNYVLNEEKTVCENGGKVVSYNNSTGQIGFSFLGSDRCSLYFDKIIDTENPVINNLTVNDTTITAILTDNIELSGYGISTSNTVEPSSWTTISGTSYNLNTTITTEGTYYLWVKDSSSNKTVSDVIDLEKKGYQAILINNGNGATTVDAAISYIKGKGKPNFSAVATTNEGMYAAEDDLGTSYYFRGAVNNNWVKFGKDSSENEMYWRIIRINGDGSIRMIYSGTTKPDSSTATVMTGTGTQIGTSTFNNSYNDPIYVGYKYASGEQHGSSNASTIKTMVDSWYKLTSFVTNNLVVDSTYCNDRSVTGSTNGTPGEIGGGISSRVTSYYGAHIRLVINRNPKLTCTTASDKFTVNTDKGNGLLTYPVGLITADEVVMAGGVHNGTNSAYYLYTNQHYWSGTPNYFDGSDTFADCFSVGTTGYLSDYSVRNILGVRPVISLSSSVKLSGSGTWNDVYTVS